MQKEEVNDAQEGEATEVDRSWLMAAALTTFMLPAQV
jgi:hypothetical protein